MRDIDSWEDLELSDDEFRRLGKVATLLMSMSTRERYQ